MTSICGVFDIACDLDCSSYVNEMMQPFSYADTSNTWHADNIALGQRTLHTTIASDNDTLPLRDELNNLTLVGDIRLDDRATLFNKLQIATNEQKDFSDGRLVLTAYKKWGKTCSEHLLGDFAFAIWDGNTKQLYCCKDPMGICSLYYYYDGRKFVFATNIQQLQAKNDIPSKINYNKLSTLVVKRAKKLFFEESWLQDIYPIPSATILTVDKSGIQKHKYWTPTLQKEATVTNEKEYIEAFRELMFLVVEDRLRSKFPVTALLSGGLDSSAIVSVAAKILERQNKDLHVFSAVLENEQDSTITDERYFIDQFRSFPNVNINYIKAPQKGFFSNLSKFETSVNALTLSSRHFLYDEFAKSAESLGSRLILDGAFGEVGPTAYGEGGYAEMFAGLNWSWLWKELRARKKMASEPFITNIRNQILVPLIPPSIIKIIKGQENFFTPESLLYLQPALIDTFKSNLTQRKKEIDTFSSHLAPSHRQNQLRAAQIVQQKSLGGMEYDKGRYTYPFKDRRLIEFSLSMPLRFKIKDGYQRYMVRAGLEGILPKEIQWRNSKGPFSPDYYRRYIAQQNEVQQFLDTISPNDPVRNIVDIEKLKKWARISISETEKDIFVERIARDLLPQAIYLICFLRRFSEFKN